VWRIRVRDVPAFLVIDDKGNDFYRRLARRRKEAASST
jgi:tartrate dehydratase beta subunit/fumarate hydratase class I family protein